MRTFALLITFILVAPLHSLFAISPEVPPATQPAPRHQTMNLVLVQDASPREYIILLDQNYAFKTLDGLKKHIASLPTDSSITWSPGCCRIGGGPLLSDPKALADFQAHCKTHKVTLVIVPAG
jgi:hypothetical protein